MGQRTDLLVAALAYAATGWPVSICRPRSKSVMIGCGTSHATTSPYTIREWWSRCPEGNIAITTGFRSGVVSVDLDGDGPETWARLYGAITAPHFQTGRGGLHLFFACPAPRASLLGGIVGAGIDLMADGGQSLMPPSIHPNGTRYEWLIPPDVPLQVLPV